MIPDEAVEAAADVFGHITGTPSRRAVEAILEAALPILLSHEREETRLAHLDAVVNAQTVDRLEGELALATLLIRYLTDSADCWFDHHGGCQAHGYLSLERGETCPQGDAKEWVRAHE